MTDVVTNVIEYNGKKITFELKRYEKPNSLLWFIEAHIHGFKKPFQSKMITSIFARDKYEQAKLETTQEAYLNKLIEDIDKIMLTKAELLTVDLDTVSIMWYCDGRVQIEEDKNLLVDIKKLIDHLDQDVSKFVLTNSGFL